FHIRGIPTIAASPLFPYPTLFRSMRMPKTRRSASGSLSLPRWGGQASPTGTTSVLIRVELLPSSNLIGIDGTVGRGVGRPLGDGVAAAPLRAAPAGGAHHLRELALLGQILQGADPIVVPVPQDTLDVAHPGTGRLERR